MFSIANECATIMNTSKRSSTDLKGGTAVLNARAVGREKGAVNNGNDNDTEDTCPCSGS